MAYYQIDNQSAPIDFEIKGDLAARTVQNAKNLLMCRMGEIPYDRYRGFDPALYDLPISELQDRLLPELDRVMMWDPDIEVVSATCTMDSKGNILITATIDVTFEN